MMRRSSNLMVSMWLGLLATIVLACAVSRPRPIFGEVKVNWPNLAGLTQNLQWAAGQSPTVSIATPTSDVATTSLTIAGQAPYASASTNKSPGNVVVNIPAPISGGSEGSFVVQRGGTPVFGVDPTGTTTMAIVGPGSQQILEYVSGSSQTLLLGGSNIGFKPYSGGGYAMYMSGVTSPNIQMFNSSGSWGSGAGVLGISNAATNPSASPSGGGILYEDGTNLALSHRGSGGAIYQIAPDGSGSQNTQEGIWYRQQAFLRTAATSATTLYTSPTIAASHVMSLRVTISSIDTTSLSSSASACVAASFVNSAGTVSQLGSTTTVYNHGYSTAPSFSISSTTVLVKVTANTTDNTDHQTDVEINYD